MVEIRFCFLRTEPDKRPRFMYLFEANWLLAVALYLPDIRVVCSDVSQQETKQEHFPTSKYMSQDLSCMSYTHSI